MRRIRPVLVLTVVSVLCLTVSQVSGRDEPSAWIFSGVVVDKGEGVPIPYAHVWVHEETGMTTFTAQPNGLGQFSVRLLPGYYDVLVGAPGFAPFAKKIWIQSGRAVTLRVTLGPDEEHMQRVDSRLP